ETRENNWNNDKPSGNMKYAQPQNLPAITPEHPGPGSAREKNRPGNSRVVGYQPPRRHTANHVKTARPDHPGRCSRTIVTPPSSRNMRQSPIVDLFLHRGHIFHGNSPDCRTDERISTDKADGAGDATGRWRAACGHTGHRATAGGPGSADRV